jgi:hypothetical protein
MLVRRETLRQPPSQQESVEPIIIADRLDYAVHLDEAGNASNYCAGDKE